MGNTNPNGKYLIGNYLCLLYLIYVCLSVLVRSESIFSLTSKRLLKDIPDPFFGPKGIRHLLVLRGFSGYVITSTYFCACSFTLLTFNTKFLWTFRCILLPPISFLIRCNRSHFSRSPYDCICWLSLPRRGISPTRSACWCLQFNWRYSHRTTRGNFWTSF